MIGSSNTHTPINFENFSKWSKENMYRTSYNTIFTTV